MYEVECTFKISGSRGFIFQLGGDVGTAAPIINSINDKIFITLQNQSNACLITRHKVRILLMNFQTTLNWMCSAIMYTAGYSRSKTVRQKENEKQCTKV